MAGRELLSFYPDMEILHMDLKYFISENPFPVEFIHPQGFQEITLSIHKGTPDRFGVVITWDDDYASGRTFEDYIQTF